MSISLGLGLGMPFAGAPASSGASAPVNAVAPAVTGTPAVGQVLTTDNGTWSNSPTGYTYQWKRNGSPIGGATSSTYTVVTADNLQALICTVTASNAAGSASADSNSVSIYSPSLVFSDARNSQYLTLLVA